MGGLVGEGWGEMRWQGWWKHTGIRNDLVSIMVGYVLE